MPCEISIDEFTNRDWQSGTDGTVRFAHVGLGWWTIEEAMPAIDDSDLCENAVVVSGEREKSERVAADHPTVTHALDYDAFKDGTARNAYDAVYVATPNALHLPYVRAAAEHGKAVLCEKPMEASVERAERMMDCCRENNTTMMIAYRMQTDPAVRRTRELVLAGQIGEPVGIHGHMSQPLLDIIPDPDQWRLDPDLSGYGATVMDLGIYPLNTARFVLDADPVAVRSELRSEHGAFDAVPDEHASFTVTFPDDVLADCTTSQNAHRVSHFRILGTEGEITLEPVFFPDQTRRMTVRKSDTVLEIEVPPVNQMTEEFDYFADRLLTERTPHPDGEHGLIDLRTIRAIHEADGTTGWIDIE